MNRVAPMLRRAEFEVHTVSPSPFVLDLVLVTWFELLIIAYPLPPELPIEQLMTAVRQDGSNCRNASLMLLADPTFLDEAASWIDRGANRVVGNDWADARLWQAVGDLLDIAPRIALRALVQVDLDARSGRDAELLRTVDISTSGMLLLGSSALPPGTRFEFVIGLPGESQPLRGSAEVVRLAAELNGDQAFGARFIGFREGGDEMLASYIAETVSG